MVRKQYNFSFPHSWFQLSTGPSQRPQLVITEHLVSSY